MVFTLILFFLNTHGLGYSLTRFIKKLSLENTIIRMGIGLGGLPVLGLFLNSLKIPLDWRIFLILTNILPVYDLGRSFIKRTISFESFKPLKAPAILLLVIFSVHLLVFCFGAFSYPWLEDSDSYDHAAGIKYIATERNISISSGQFHYMNPYPPGYDLLMGVLHQTCPSLYKTLKFFTSLIVSLGLIFFFYYIQELSKDTHKALWATFFLAIIPCYLTHFIWAHSLVITLFFPSLYLLNKSSSDRRFILPASIVTAGIFVIQPTQSLKLVILILLIFVIVSSNGRKIFSRYLKILFYALIISLLWWLPILLDIIRGSSMFAAIRGSPTSTIGLTWPLLNPEGGSATRAYTLGDYLLFPKINLINSPTGVGAIFFVLAIMGIPICLNRILKTKPPENNYPFIILIWLTFTFLGMNSETFHLPVGLFAFRFWLLFAVPVVLLSTETLFFIIAKIRRSFYTYGLMVITLLGLLATAGFHKFVINTGIWSQGPFFDSANELKGFLWMKDNLKPNTKVFAFTENMLVIGHDMHADYWSAKYKQSFANAIQLETAGLYDRLVNNRFEYLIVSEKDARTYGPQKAQEMLNSLFANPYFYMIYNIPDSFWLFKIEPVLLK